MSKHFLGKPLHVPKLEDIYKGLGIKGPDYPLDFFKEEFSLNLDAETPEDTDIPDQTDGDAGPLITI